MSTILSISQQLSAILSKTQSVSAIFIISKQTSVNLSNSQQFFIYFSYFQLFSSKLSKPLSVSQHTSAILKKWLKCLIIAEYN